MSSGLGQIPGSFLDSSFTSYREVCSEGSDSTAGHQSLRASSSDHDDLGKDISRELLQLATKEPVADPFGDSVRDQSRSASISLSHFPFSFITFLLHLSFSHLSIYWTLCSPFTCFPFIFMPCYVNIT